MKILHLFSFLAVLAIILTNYSCSEKAYDKSDPAQSFAYARESYDKANYDVAKKNLGEFKSRFPYSRYTSTAELFIANAHYELKEYEEAAFAYDQFLKLHPRHEKADFALFRIGESYWADAPEEVDRDQEYTYKAIAEWERLITRFPDSEYTKKAQELSAKGKRRIAESYEFVADFYCKVKIFHACAYRFLRLAENYPQYPDLLKKALNKTAYALENLAKAKQKEPDSDKNLYFKRLSVEQMREKAQTLRKRVDNL